MAFTASTREMMQALGILDDKTLHRRREDYKDKFISPAKQFLKLGVHYLRKSPSPASPLVWDPEATKRAWIEASRTQSRLLAEAQG